MIVPWPDQPCKIACQSSRSQLHKIFEYQSLATFLSFIELRGYRNTLPPLIRHFHIFCAFAEKSLGRNSIKFGMLMYPYFWHDRPWISPWIKSISNDWDITIHVIASQLSGHETVRHSSTYIILYDLPSADIDAYLWISLSQLFMAMQLLFNAPISRKVHLYTPNVKRVSDVRHLV